MEHRGRQPSDPARVRAMNYRLPKGIDPQADWRDLQYAALDTETTGVAPDSRVVEIAIIHVDGEGNVQDEWSTLVNPTSPIPKGASNVHGISDKMVKDALKYGEVYDEVVQRIRSRVPLVYNLPYDWRILKNEAVRLHKPWFAFFGVCPLTLSRCHVPGVPGGYSQTNLTRHLGIHDDDADDHRALADTRHTVQVMFDVLAKQKLDGGLSTIRQLWDHQVDFARRHEERLRIRWRKKSFDAPWNELTKEM